MIARTSSEQETKGGAGSEMRFKNAGGEDGKGISKSGTCHTNPMASLGGWVVGEGVVGCIHNIRYKSARIGWAAGR
jgi:hypothetical protein